MWLETDSGPVQVALEDLVSSHLREMTPEEQIGYIARTLAKLAEHLVPEDEQVSLLELYDVSYLSQAAARIQLRAIANREKREAEAAEQLAKQEREQREGSAFLKLMPPKTW